ncbi:TniB family NTP-binding protein [uncultured Endozoicomonas sp.]|uniref:TniB family NTP-binding protein n=1 Tax=uncultured Endozoicomonas sp. TaxID=432652 RepID=UPI0026029127|nr:TniB family NTP-binding protein [uncultured Endozoicomonas sp.]
MNSDIESKLGDLENLFIGTPYLQEIIDDIEDFRKFARLNNYKTEPDSILITGASGSGKTWLINEIIRLNPRIEEGDRTKIQVLSSSIPKAKSAKPVVQTLLSDIGDPLQGKGDTISGLTSRLDTLIRNTGTELIIIDEFQHCLETDSKKVIHAIGDWVKTLINLSKRPVILFGMPWSDIILETNVQLARRFCIHHKMPSYGVNNFSDFQCFLYAVDRKLPFPKISGLADKDLAFRLLCSTEGNIGKLMKNVIKKAARKAIIYKFDSIPREYLEDAVGKYCGYLKNDNPMLLPIDQIKFEDNDSFDLYPNSKIIFSKSKSIKGSFYYSDI